MTDIELRAHGLALEWIRSHPPERSVQDYDSAYQEKLTRVYYSAYWTIFWELYRLEKDPSLDRLRSNPASM